MGKKVAILGSGFASLSASCYLARDGYEVTVFEKNEQLGGRASQFTRDGFTFDTAVTDENGQSKPITLAVPEHESTTLVIDPEIKWASREENR